MVAKVSCNSSPSLPPYLPPLMTPLLALIELETYNKLTCGGGLSTAYLSPQP